MLYSFISCYSDDVTQKMRRFFLYAYRLIMRQDLSELEDFIFPDLLHLAQIDDDGEIIIKSVSEVYKRFIKTYTKRQNTLFFLMLNLKVKYLKISMFMEDRMVARNIQSRC